MSQENDTLSLPECIVMIALFAFGLALVFSAERTTLKCKRLQLNQKVTCEATYSRLHEKWTMSAGIVQGAEIRPRKKRSYVVVLLTEIDKIPIESYSGATYNKTGAMKKAQQINNFINNPEQMSLEIVVHYDWLIFIIGAAFVVLFLIALLCALWDFIEIKSNIKRIHREIENPDHQDDKSDL